MSEKKSLFPGVPDKPGISEAQKNARIVREAGERQRATLNQEEGNGIFYDSSEELDEIEVTVNENLSEESLFPDVPSVDLDKKEKLENAGKVAFNNITEADIDEAVNRLGEADLTEPMEAVPGIKATEVGSEFELDSIGEELKLPEERAYTEEASFYQTSEADGAGLDILEDGEGEISEEALGLVRENASLGQEDDEDETIVDDGLPDQDIRRDESQDI